MLLLNDNALNGDVPADSIHALNNLDYLWLQGNPLLTGILNCTTANPTTEHWIMDCSSIECSCCTKCNTNTTTPDNDVLVQYNDPRWFHSYERPNYEWENL